jgi:two-component system chemotaxis response regulator CheB
MIVDDSAIVRGLIAQILETDDRIVVTASVSDGSHALRTLQREDVDIVLLDIEMREMDGLTALPQMLAARPGIRVIIVSSMTQRNAEISLRALSMGAVDYVNKPSSRHELFSTDNFKVELLTKIGALGAGIGRGPAVPDRHQSRENEGRSPLDRGTDRDVPLRPGSRVRPTVLAIGSSTGGPAALKAFLPSIPSALTIPILITQHIPATFTAFLTATLAQVSDRPALEPCDGQPVEAGHIYVAPGGYHMLVERRNSKPVFRLSDSAPENFCRPSVDPMLRSVAQTYGPGVVAVILTGMGQDGRAGSTVVVEMGGTVLAQDEASSVVWGMPGAVANDGLCAAILPLDEIGQHISTLAA